MNVWVWKFYFWDKNNFFFKLLNEMPEAFLGILNILEHYSKSDCNLCGF